MPRVPWIATLDELISELNKQIDNPITGPRARLWPPLRGFTVLTASINTSSNEMSAGKIDGINKDGKIEQVIYLLIDARDKLKSSILLDEAGDIHPHERQFREGDLDGIDRRQSRYPAVEGREGLAGFVEQGGLFGPIMGKEIADAIRGTKSFKPGPKGTFEDGRTRRFAVKRIATIQHLYGVGVRKAAEMFCNHHCPDDPDVTAVDRHLQWVKRDQREAGSLLKKGGLSSDEERHLKGLLHGLQRNLPHGSLKGGAYPGAFDDLIKGG